jgi:Haem-binding domain
VRLRRALVATLVIVAIGSAARSHPEQGVVGADPSAALNGRTPVPAPVMSTLRRACFDCHSDETRWPWYATLPLASHLIERDVSEGRGQLNLSRWMQYNAFDRADMLDKMCRMASSGRMPLWQYRLMHPGARVLATDVATLCAWSQDEMTRLVQEER